MVFSNVSGESKNTYSQYSWRPYLKASLILQNGAREMLYMVCDGIRYFQEQKNNLNTKGAVNDRPYDLE